MKRYQSHQPQLSKNQALSLIPVKNMDIAEETLDNGDILIRYPITLRPWMAKLFQRFRGSSPKTEYKRLQLDKLGTEVWIMIDGKRSVGELIENFSEIHKLNIREAEVAVTQFLRDLGKRGVMGLKE